MQSVKKESSYIMLKEIQLGMTSKLHFQALRLFKIRTFILLEENYTCISYQGMKLRIHGCCCCFKNLQTIHQFLGWAISFFQKRLSIYLNILIQLYITLQIIFQNLEPTKNFSTSPVTMGDSILLFLM